MEKITYKYNIQQLLYSHNLGFHDKARPMVFLGEPDNEQSTLIKRLQELDFNTKIVPSIEEYREFIRSESKGIQGMIKHLVIICSLNFKTPVPRQGTLIISYRLFENIFKQRTRKDAIMPVVESRQLVFPIVSTIFEGRRILVATKSSRRLLEARTRELNGIIVSPEILNPPDFVIIDEGNDFCSDAVLRNLLNFAGEVKFRNARLINYLWNESFKRELNKRDLDLEDEGRKFTLCSVPKNLVVCSYASTNFYVTNKNKSSDSVDLTENVLFLNSKNNLAEMRTRKRTAYCIGMDTHQECTFSHYPLFVTTTSYASSIDSHKIFSNYEIDLVGFERTDREFLESVLQCLGANDKNNSQPYSKFSLLNEKYVIGLPLKDKLELRNKLQNVGPVLNYQFVKTCGEEGGIVLPRPQHKIPLSLFLLTPKEHHTIYKKYLQLLNDYFLSHRSIQAQLNRCITQEEINVERNLVTEVVMNTSTNIVYNLLIYLFKLLSVEVIETVKDKKRFLFSPHHIDERPVPLAVLETQSPVISTMTIKQMAFEVFVYTIRQKYSACMENLDDILFESFLHSPQNNSTEYSHVYCCDQAKCRKPYLHCMEEVMDVIGADNTNKTFEVCVGCGKERKRKCIASCTLMPYYYFRNRNNIELD